MTLVAFFRRFPRFDRRPPPTGKPTSTSHAVPAIRTVTVTHTFYADSHDPRLFTPEGRAALARALAERGMR